MALPVYYKYNFSVAVYNTTQRVNVDADCNGFTVTNIGDTIVTVNGCILNPGVPGTSLGDSRTFGGNFGERYVGDIRISFSVPLGVAPSVEVIQKFYVA
jgi:hypothetical protein